MTPSGADEVPPGRGLPPRPQPEPEILALVSAAATWLSSPRAALGERPADPPHLRWRFSGRWWARPTVARRNRPWTRGG